MKKFLLIVFIVLLHSVCFGATYYVDGDLVSDCTSGDYSISSRNCSGSDGNAYNTFSDILSSLSPGDIVYVRSGNYAENIQMQASGSTGNEITFQAYTGENPVIDGPVGVDNQINFVGHDYIIWDGIDSKEGQKYGIFIGNGSDYITIKNTKIYSNTYTGLSTNTNIGIIIQDCEFYSNGWNGLDINKCSDCLITGNTSYNNTNHMGMQFGSSTEGVWTEDTVVENNISYNNQNGYYFALFRNSIFRKNLSYENSNNGLVINYYSNPGPIVWTANLKIYNNTIVDNGGGGIVDYYANNLKIKNNIVTDNVDQDLYISRINNHSIDYNLYYNSTSFRWSSTNYSTLAAFNSASSQEANGYDDTNPQYTDQSGDDYTLSGSSPTDNGSWLTTTTSGGSGIQVPINDASYFAVGDTVQFQGQVVTYEVIMVNTSSNVITLNSSASWSSGLGIALEYSGVKPDMGAFEYEEIEQFTHSAGPGTINQAGAGTVNQVSAE